MDDPGEHDEVDQNEVCEVCFLYEMVEVEVMLADEAHGTAKTRTDSC